MRIFILILGIFTLFHAAEAALAAMAIDFGSQYFKVGLVKPGVPMEIVLNKESRRKTPNLLSIRNGERLFGDAALGMNVRYPRTVYGNLLELVGKHIDHPTVDLFKQRNPHLVIEKSENGTGIVVPFGEVKYSVESLMAMILASAKQFTEAYAEQPVTDVVITVPVYFGQAERLAVEQAAKIAKLNLLQLINDGTAVALSHGIFRRKEITEKAQRLLIYDVGASKTTVTLVEFQLVKEKYGKEPKMTVLGVGYDQTLGGQEMTNLLRDHLVKRFRENYKTKKDITTDDRAMGKLMKEAESLKKVLSANVMHFAQIESVHEDIDMRIKVTRDEFNELIAPLVSGIEAPLKQALAMAELRLDDVDQIALFGAGTRVPKVQEAIQEAVKGKELGRFLNTDEAAAMGALFQTAHLSKGFKVKPFNVAELVIYPVQVNFVSKQKQEDGEVLSKDVVRPIFSYKTKYPSNKKALSFTSYTNDFNFSLSYGEMSHFTEQQKTLMGLTSNTLVSVDVAGLADAISSKVVPDETEFKGVKISFQLDLSGILRITSAEAVIEKKSGVVESITSTISGFFSGTKEEGEATDAVEPKKDEEEAENSEEKPEKTAEEEKKEEEPAKEEDKKEEKGEEKDDKEKTKEDADDKTPKNKTEKAKPKIPAVQKVKLVVKKSYADGNVLDAEDVDSAKKILEAFERTEKLAAERAAAENELEAFAYEAFLLSEEEEFITFSTEEERTKLATEVARVRAWLEDDTSPATKTGEFKENYNIIRDIVFPIKKRITESKTLPAALDNLNQMINSSKIFVTMGGGENSLFEKTDTEAFGKKLEKLEKWLEEKTSAQAKKKENEDPALFTSEVEGKIKALDRELNSFMKKMKKERTVNLNKDKKKESDKKSSSSSDTPSETPESETPTKENESTKEETSKSTDEEKPEKTEL